MHSHRQTDVQAFIASFLSRSPSVHTFALRATASTEEFSSFEAIPQLREFHVHGFYDVLPFLPRVICALEEAESSNLREVFLKVQDHLNSKAGWDKDERRERRAREPLLGTKLALEQMIGKTEIPVMETKDLARKGGCERERNVSHS